VCSIQPLNNPFTLEAKTMNTTTLALVVLGGVLLVLYMVRRNGRLSQED
jgi:hypothetical protein